jgi:hypothetical protein
MAKNRYPTDSVSRGDLNQAGFADIVRHLERYSTRIKFRTLLKAGMGFKYSTDLLRRGPSLKIVLRQGDVEIFKDMVAAKFPDGTLDGFQIVVDVY